jgi:hypothetical protein
VRVVAGHAVKLHGVRGDGGHRAALQKLGAPVKRERVGDGGGQPVGRHWLRPAPRGHCQIQRGSVVGGEPIEGRCPGSSSRFGVQRVRL